jgi:uncharacterized protein YndB with AHSA1/START domain
MPRAEATIEIDRSPEDVFDFLAAGENNVLWRCGVLDIERVSGEGVGATWRQGHRGPAGRRLAADYEVTEHVRPSRLGFRVIAGPARPQGLYGLETVAGGTRLTFSLWWEPKGLARLLASPVQGTMDAEVGQVAKLKTVLEKR